MRFHLLFLLVLPLGLFGCGSEGGTSTANCGDNVRDTGEECDDGNTTPGDGCDASCQLESTCGDDTIEGLEQCDGGDNCHPPGHYNACQFIESAFRMNSFTLVDPGFWSGGGNPEGEACLSPFTSTVNDGLTDSVNGDLVSNLAPASALDGLVDLGFVFTFGPLLQGDGETTSGAFVVSDCEVLEPSPSKVGGPTPCSPTVAQPSSSAAYTLTTQTSGTCLEALADTTGPDLPTIEPVVEGDDGCWVTDPIDFVVSLGSIAQIPMSETQIAAQWDGSPSTGLVSGLVRGFLTAEDAAAIEIDLLGGLIKGKLGDFLSPPGADESCQHQDPGPNDEDGWWMYFAFTAETVPWEGDLMCGDGTLDEPGTIGSESRDETCDPGLNAAQCDTLVADCVDDGPGCIDRTVNAGDRCTPTCFERTITEEADGDGCCPGDATPEDDADCTAS